MATIRIPVGTAHYGTIFHRGGGSSSTRFFFVGYFPLIPLGGERTIPDEHGTLHSEDRLYLPSLLLALFNAWGLVALWVLFNRAYFQAGHTMEKTLQALVMMTALFASWIWGGGMWRFPELRRVTLIKATALVTVGFVLGAVMITETRQSLRYEAQRRFESMSPENRLAAFSSTLEKLANEERATKQSALETLCAQGDQNACVEAARPLEKTDPKSAQAIYQRACDANAGLGCSRLGLMHRYGSPPDLAGAWELMKRACDLGDGFGCFHLGDMTKLGSGVPRDPLVSAAYLERACELGYPKTCKKR